MYGRPGGSRRRGFFLLMVVCLAVAASAIAALYLPGRYAFAAERAGHQNRIGSPVAIQTNIQKHFASGSAVIAFCAVKPIVPAVFAMAAFRAVGSAGTPQAHSLADAVAAGAVVSDHILG